MLVQLISSNILDIAATPEVWSLGIHNNSTWSNSTEWTYIQWFLTSCDSASHNYISLTPHKSETANRKTPGEKKTLKNNHEIARTFQRAIFKLSSWHFKLYYANGNFFSSFFLGNNIFHLTTLFEGVLPSFWKAPTLSPVSHDIICPCLTCAHIDVPGTHSRYEDVRLCQKESSHYCMVAGSESIFVSLGEWHFLIENSPLSYFYIDTFPMVIPYYT